MSRARARKRDDLSDITMVDTKPPTRHQVGAALHALQRAGATIDDLRTIHDMLTAPVPYLRDPVTGTRIRKQAR